MHAEWDIAAAPAATQEAAWLPGASGPGLELGLGPGSEEGGAEEAARGGPGPGLWPES